MSDLLRSLVENIPLPRVYRIRQRFDDTKLVDPIAELRSRLRAYPADAGFAPGRKVAVAVGSRGISRIDELTAAVVEELKRAGAEPFIVPCMGSHGEKPAGEASRHPDIDVLEGPCEWVFDEEGHLPK